MIRATMTVLAVALVLAGAATATSTGKVIAHGQTLKGAHGKIALVEVNAVKPTTLTLKVDASPKQSVKIDYSVVCVKNSDTNQQGYNTSSTPKTGTTHITAPGSFTLPMALTHPASCEVAVYSTLSKSGKQTVQLAQT